MLREKYNLYVIVVIYNKSCYDSLTLKCLNKIHGLDVTICDNSTKNYKNKEYAENKNYNYIDMQGNKGLAVAYNKAICRIKQNNGYVCIFDDDTLVPAEYFKVLEESIVKEHKDIYLPIIYDSVGMLSPARIVKGFFVKREKNLKNINQKNITGINSAMAINLDVFEEGYLYNEKYFLDYIDHDFIREMKKRNKTIGVLNVKLKQNFSGNNFENKEASLKRFKIFKKDFKNFCKGNFFCKLCSYFVIIKRLFRLTLKFRTLDFIFKS